MSNYLDDTHGGCEEIREISYALEEISRAFDLTGNEAMAERLYRISADLSTAERKIHKAVGEEVSRSFRQAEQASTNMLRTALACSELLHEQEVES